MTREEREAFVRSQVFNDGTWEAAVQAIVDRWEEDVQESREDAAQAASEAAFYDSYRI